MMKYCLIVGLGGFVGAILRYLLSIIFGASGLAFPLVTFACNVLGCLIIGLALGMADRFSFFTPEIKLLVVTGFCGALTTFSTFTNENLNFLRDANYGMFFIYVFSSLLLGLLATVGGYALAKI